MMMSAAGPGRIGPNAVTQVAAALVSRYGPVRTRDLFSSVGLTRYLDAPPHQMIDEREVIALHTAVREGLVENAVSAVNCDAGLATGDYLLAHRIPRPAQVVLRMLPARLAGALLLTAIRRHAWTFAGSGHFSAQGSKPILITIEDCPICRGAHTRAAACGYYTATFTRLFTRLVHPRARVRETACIARGDSACRFEVDWG